MSRGNGRTRTVHEAAAVVASATGEAGRCKAVGVWDDPVFQSRCLMSQSRQSGCLMAQSQRERTQIGHSCAERSKSTPLGVRVTERRRVTGGGPNLSMPLLYATSSGNPVCCRQLQVSTEDQPVSVYLRPASVYLRAEATRKYWLCGGDHRFGSVVVTLGVKRLLQVLVMTLGVTLGVSGGDSAGGDPGVTW
eukprot:334857-Chlamydomonas_euryale.AAC.6